MSTESGNKLQEFLDKAATILEDILNEKSYKLLDGVSELAKKVWETELKKEVVKLKVKISEAYCTNLRKVGLVGLQLDFKIQVFDKIYDKWLSDGKKWIRKILAAINSILSSMSKVFFQAELIKEFKDFLEVSLLDETV